MKTTTMIETGRVVEGVEQGIVNGWTLADFERKFPGNRKVKSVAASLLQLNAKSFAALQTRVLARQASKQGAKLARAGEGVQAKRGTNWLLAPRKAKKGNRR